LAPLLLPVVPPALTWLTGGLGLGLIALGAGVLYIAFGELPALAFGVGAASTWLVLTAINPFTPLIPALALSGATLAFGSLALAAAAAALLALRSAEQREQEGELAWELAHFERVEAAEDQQLQNHLITVSQLKPGYLRPYALRVVLRAVSLLAKVYFNHGDLGSIRSIHFARFVILPDKQRLLFLSNYDGAFGAYLDDFHSVPGVTAVWSNTVGFPRSSFLIFDGALDEQRFKAFARRDQLPSHYWYSAYPNLSVQDIDAATRLREDLGRRLAAPKGLVGRLWRRFNSTLDEAACDAALRRV
jgi:hypothetical protein